MAVKINDEIRALLDDPTTYKALASIDKNGIPHVTYKDSFHVNEDGNLAYYEIIETSQTNKNLVNSIWFHKMIAVNLVGQNKKSYQIKGTPIKAIISGKEFEKYYLAVREQLGDVDLSTVWIIEPEILIEETFEKRRIEEEEAHPLLRHLDRLIEN